MDPITAFIVNLIIGVILSVASTLVQQAFAQDTKTKTAGVRGSLQTGGDNPLAFIMGFYATAGQLEYAGTWGNVDETPNAYYTKVISLSDIPVNGVTGMFVNGEKVTIGGVATGDFGYPVSEYTVGGTAHLWVKFYTGTQTTRDPLLATAFGTDADRPWATTHVGNGVAYAVVTALVNRELFSGLPEYLFEVEGIKLYDPRLDTTAGGSGTHRLADPATWAYSNNPIVAIYNILCGIYYGTEWVWGPQNIAQARLPYANWSAEMNKCDALINLAAGGTEKRFRFGLEVSVDQEPHAVIGELLKACEGRIAEIGGVYKILVGEPGSSVKSITDEDIVITEGQSYEPFPGLESTFNGITATYPEPLEAWESKEAPPRYSAALETLDDARRLPFSTSYKAAPYPNQVQRIMLASVNETRRFRRHSATMPAEWWEYEPLDVYDWTSTRNSYTAKKFLILVMDDLPNGNQIVGSQEIDPTDYNGWTTANELPWDTAPLVVARPALQAMTGWAVVPYTHVDSASTARRPGIQVSYAGGMVDVRGVRVQVRRSGETTPIFDSDEYPYDVGTALPANIIVGDFLLPNQAYEARGKFVPFSGRETSWSSWLAVTTPDVRLGLADLDVTLQNMQSYFGVQIRELTEAMQLATALGERQDASNFRDRLSLAEKLVLGDDVVSAAYIRAILLALGADGSALADAITAVEAANGEITAGLLTRMSVFAGPVGWSRYGVQARVDVNTAFAAAASLYLEAKSDGSSRIVLKGGETYILDASDNVLAAFGSDGLVTYARIPNINTDKIIAGAVTSGLLADLAVTGVKIADSAIIASKIAAGQIVAGKIAAGAIDTSSLFVNGVVITDLIAANAISQATTASNDADVTLSTGGGYTLLVSGSVTVPASASGVLVQMQSIGRNNGNDCAPQFLIQRNGVTIHSFTGGFIFNNFGYDPKRMLTTNAFTDAPGTGTHTYAIYARAIDSGNYRAALMSDNRLIMTAFKR